MFFQSLFFYEYIQNIIKKYSQFKPLWETTAIGFAGTNSENAIVQTPPVDADTLIFGFNVDFSNTGVLLSIKDTSSGYVFNVLQSTGTTQLIGTPIVAIAGVTTQVTPVLPLICPFWMSRQSRLEYTFRNSTSGATTGGNITAVGIKLFS
jgi:hypothetical protein